MRQFVRRCLDDPRMGGAGDRVGADVDAVTFGAEAFQHRDDQMLIVWTASEGPPQVVEGALLRISGVPREPQGIAHFESWLAPESAATLVYWTCNHCPYAIAWHDRLLDVARDYADRGVRTLAVNSNDAEKYPADSLEAMTEIGLRRSHAPKLSRSKRASTDTRPASPGDILARLGTRQGQMSASRGAQS